MLIYNGIGTHTKVGHNLQASGPTKGSAMIQENPIFTGFFFNLVFMYYCRDYSTIQVPSRVSVSFFRQFIVKLLRLAS